MVNQNNYQEFVRVIVQGGNNDILLLAEQRMEYGAECLIWNFPGGKVEKGESPLETAKRELTEELNVSADSLELIYNGECVFEDKIYYGYYYIATYIIGNMRNAEPHKVLGYGFFNLKFIDLIRFWPTIRLCPNVTEKILPILKEKLILKS